MTPGLEPGMSISMQQRWIEDFVKEDPLEANLFLTWIEAQIAALTPDQQQKPMLKQQTMIQ
eukprot:10903590-Karenia_brevis.AAC.1